MAQCFAKGGPQNRQSLPWHGMVVHFVLLRALHGLKMVLARPGFGHLQALPQWWPRWPVVHQKGSGGVRSSGMPCRWTLLVWPCWLLTNKAHAVPHSGYWPTSCQLTSGQ